MHSADLIVVVLDCFVMLIEDQKQQFRTSRRASSSSESIIVLKDQLLADEISTAQERSSCSERDVK